MVVDDFVEIRKGRFIERSRYDSLVNGLGLSADEVCDYLDKEIFYSRNRESLVGKPLTFQKKVEK